MCLRIAVELGLHQERITDLTSAFEEQTRRIVFWDCYHLDWASSSTLGRPPGIADADISIPLPINANEEAVLGQPDVNLITSDRANSELSIFIHTLFLSRIESAIQASLQSPGTTTTSWADDMHGAVGPCFPWSETTFLTIETHCSSLRRWWEERPLSVHPHLLEKSELYLTFYYRRAKLKLVRAVLDGDSSRGAHSSELLRGCLRTACSLLETFASLRAQGLVTYTRGYMHLIFSTGLTLTYTCVQLVAKQRAKGPAIDEEDVNDWWLDFFRELPVAIGPTDTLDALNTASRLLWWMSEHIPGTSQYSRGFDRLKNNFACFLDEISDSVKEECFAGKRSLQPDHGPQLHHGSPWTVSPAANDGSGAERQTRGVVIPAQMIPADVSEDATGIYGNRADYPEALPSWDTSLWPQGDDDAWSYMQMPMDQFAYDLVDYAWEAPVLWPDGDMSLN